MKTIKESTGREHRMECGRKHWREGGSMVWNEYERRW